MYPSKTLHAGPVLAPENCLYDTPLHYASLDYCGHRASPGPIDNADCSCLQTSIEVEYQSICPQDNHKPSICKLQHNEGVSKSEPCDLDYDKVSYTLDRKVDEGDYLSHDNDPDSDTHTTNTITRCLLAALAFPTDFPTLGQREVETNRL